MAARTPETGEHLTASPGWICAVLLTVALATGPATAQDLGRLGQAHADTLRLSAEGILQLRPFVVPGSVRVRPVSDTLWLAPQAFALDPASGQIRVFASFPPGMPFLASYRALPVGVGAEFRLSREPVVESPSPGRNRPGQPQSQPPGGTGLISRGSISRGVIAGSNRDLAVESGLRLELDGELAPGVAVRASLSDADSPIRPDGSTQRLSEFDRVFIRMSAKPGSVVLGDFDARLTGSRFGGLNRKLQGVMLESQSESVSIKAAGAVSRGEFQSQTIVPQDGVQGPYRLEGSGGERFVLILPGSESVYLDGRLLTRGEQADYTVDYSVGELTFTGRNVITSDRRISVEFQFATHQFTRTLSASEFSVGLGGTRPKSGAHRLTIGGTFIREADSGEFLSEFGLTSQDSLLLAGAGDTVASRSGAQQVVYDPEARYVHYLAEPHGADSIFVAVTATPPPGARVYRVQFTRVGEGQGSYAREAGGVNGIAYAYRGPGMGAYDPIRLLPRPGLKRLVGIHGEARPVNGLVVWGEWAHSATDLNRLSDLDTQDDAGTAGWFGMELEPIGLGRGEFTAVAQSRRTSQFFRAFERFRPVEFARDWNLDGVQLATLGTAPGASSELERSVRADWRWDDSTGIGGSIAQLLLPGLFSANRAEAAISVSLPGAPTVALEHNGVSSSFEETLSVGTWARDQIRISDARDRLSWFAEVERESRRNFRGDSLSATSFRALEVRPGVGLTGTMGALTAYLERRTEAWPFGGGLEAAARSWTMGATAETASDVRSRATINVAWRTRRIEETFKSRPEGQETRALFLSGNGASTVRRVQLDWLYDAKSERTPVLQEIFLKAGPELGTYVWVDDNGDSVVQLDELLPETTPNEGTYLRTFFPSDSLASVSSVRARVVARYRSEARPGPGVRWEAQTLLEVEERSRTDRRADVYLLRLDRFRQPGQTTLGRLRVRQDVSAAHAPTGLRASASFQDSRSLSEMASGSESRDSRQGELTLGFRLNQALDATLRGGMGRENTTSSRFASRQYRITSRTLSPGLSYRRPRVGASVSLDIVAKRDVIVGRQANILRVPVTGRWARTRQGELTGRVELSDVRLSGTAPTGMAAFELTDGRGFGRSFLWGLSAQWVLSGGLRATVAYDARAPSEGAVIHTGRVQLSAVF